LGKRFMNHQHSRVKECTCVGDGEERRGSLMTVT